MAVFAPSCIFCCVEFEFEADGVHASLTARVVKQKRAALQNCEVTGCAGKSRLQILEGSDPLWRLFNGSGAHYRDGGDSVSLSVNCIKMFVFV